MSGLRSVSVVVPVYNNRSSLRELVDRVFAALDGTGRDIEMVLVDDGSRDGSWELIDEAATRDDRVVGVRLSRNFGQHPAIRAGLGRSTGDLVVLMDADLQDRPEELPRLLAAVDEGPDVVFTTWESPDDRVRERWSSRVFHRVFAGLAGVDLPRNLGTYRIFTRDYCEAVLSYPESGAVYGPLMAQMGFESGWVSVTRDVPDGRESSYTLRKRVGLATNTLLSYSDLPYRLVSWIGAGLLVASVLYLIALLVQYAVEGPQVASGITLVVVLLLLLTGAILLSLGVLGAYLFRIFREVLHRPHFHVSASAGRGLVGGTGDAAA